MALTTRTGAVTVFCNADPTPYVGPAAWVVSRLGLVIATSLAPAGWDVVVTSFATGEVRVSWPVGVEITDGYKVEIPSASEFEPELG